MTIALTGVGILVISALGGWLIVRRHSSDQPTQVKAVLFGLYFWGLVFLQLILAAMAYYLTKQTNLAS